MNIRNNDENRCLLQEVSLEELMEYRLSKNPGLLIKIQSRLFLAKSSDHSSLISKTFGSSLCKTCDNICKGCPKVNDLTLSIHLGFGRSFSDSVGRYGRPEKYDFITFAVEPFNQKDSTCIVAECSNYRKLNPEDYEEQFFAETI